MRHLEVSGRGCSRVLEGVGMKVDSDEIWEGGIRGGGIFYNYNDDG